MHGISRILMRIKCACRTRRSFLHALLDERQKQIPSRFNVGRLSLSGEEPLEAEAFRGVSLKFLGVAQAVHPPVRRLLLQTVRRAS